MKKIISMIIAFSFAFILICMTKYAILRNRIEFINSNESRQILWGQILSEFDFVKKIVLQKIARSFLIMTTRL